MQKAAVAASVVFICLFFPLPAQGELAFSGYIEAGRRSTAEDYQEEDSDDDYAYRNYHFRFKETLPSRLSYDIASFIYGKDYKTKDALDNISRIVKANFSGSAPFPAELDFALKYRERRFDNAPANNYDQIQAGPEIKFGQKDLYSASLKAGVNNYDYLDTSIKDQLGFFMAAGMDRYFLDKKLTVSPGYKLDFTEQKTANRERLKNNLGLGLDYIFDLPFIYKILTRTSWGIKDSKEDDE